MPHKDPEAARQYFRNRHQRLRDNPEYRAKRNEHQKEWRRKKSASDPIYRADKVNRTALWRKENPASYRELERRRRGMPHVREYRAAWAALPNNAAKAWFRKATGCSAANAPMNLIEAKAAQILAIRAARDTEKEPTEPERS